MRIATLSALALVAGLLSVSSAQAVFIPIGAPVVVAPVKGTPDSRTPGKITSKNGTAYTISAFCPPSAALGTCTGESLSDPELGGSFVAGTPGKPGSCTQHGVEISGWPPKVSGASKPCK